MSIQRFRKRPVVIEAIQYTGNNGPDVRRFIGQEPYMGCEPRGIRIETLEGAMFVDDGDWVIKGVKGEFYPCKAEIFEATYEPVNHHKDG